MEPPNPTAAGGGQVDVLVVGCGPVGQLLAIQLGDRGHRVAVIDRFTTPYDLPRAVHYDDEIARLFDSIGVADRMAAISEPVTDYAWQTADGRTLVHFDWSAPGAHAWPRGNMFSQPALEAVLAERLAKLPNVHVTRGAEAVAIREQTDAVEVTVRSTDGGTWAIPARYVVGCDGANSFVRGQLDTEVVDRGFTYDWLILDVVLGEAREWRPVNLQICDPARPTTAVSGGPGRRRWEFMRLPGESVEQLSTVDTAWRLLSRWNVTPDNAVLERHTVYTFQARWATSWRRGRLMVAGDAAHLMPPFAGQGMCSGMRDAANLAWKLDLVLAGVSPAAVLDSYGVERSAHVQQAIGLSVELGNIICIADEEVAAARDEFMLEAAGGPGQALPPEVLGPGLLHQDADGQLTGPTGQLVPQGIVRASGGVSGRFDRVVGNGLFVMVDASSGLPDWTPDQREGLRRLGVRCVALLRDPYPGSFEGWEPVVEETGRYAAFLAGVGWTGMVIRPDLYVFGGAADAAGVALVVDDLLRQLLPG